jgi:hypothetical protein
LGESLPIGPNARATVALNDVEHDMTMPHSASVESASWQLNSGVCAQDFETTIQRYVTPHYLRGMLNFSALWNKTIYIYDVAITYHQ